MNIFRAGVTDMINAMHTAGNDLLVAVLWELEEWYYVR